MRVDGGKFSPWRLIAWVALLVHKTGVRSLVAEGHRRTGRAGGHLSGLAQVGGIRENVSQLGIVRHASPVGASHAAGEREAWLLDAKRGERPQGLEFLELLQTIGVRFGRDV